MKVKLEGEMAKKDYSNFNKEELIEEIKKLEKRKKYGLVWEDKPEKVVEMCKEKLPILEEDRIREIIADTEKPFNILIEGDNYHALSVLNYTHNKKIDAIYIDPPYNTGASDWKYNNKYVNADDAYRHSKWLNFIKNRLTLCKDILKEDGIICVTIDDYELPRLWLLLDDIFGAENFLGNVVIRNNPSGRKTKRKVAQVHEYALFFGKSQNSFIKNISIEMDKKSHVYKKGKNGKWYSPTNLRKQGVDSQALKPDGSFRDRWYPIYYDPKTGKLTTKLELPIKIWPIDAKGEKRIWRRSTDIIDKMYQEGDLWCQETKYGYQVYFKFYGGVEGEPPKSIWYDSKFSASEHGTNILNEILGKREMFPFPKSIFAVEECIKVMTNNKNAIILDFFAGSGTTAQAVLELNKLDGGDRKFILCTNNENNIMTEVCYPRIKKVIQKLEKEQQGKLIKDMPGNLKFFKTNFVDAEPTDRNKEAMVKKSTEMLCLKEECFDELKNGNNFKIFTDNKDKLLGIVYNDSGIEPIKKEITKFNKKFIVYVFSLDDSAREEEFEDVKDLVELKPIPAVILNVYRRIFK